jgi:hypothetical protein
MVTVQRLGRAVLSALGEWNKRAAGFHDALWLRPTWIGLETVVQQLYLFTDLRPAELRTKDVCCLRMGR